MSKLLHKIAHLLKWNYGIPESFYEGDKLMMSFKCTGCGERTGVHQIDSLIDSMLKE